MHFPWEVVSMFVLKEATTRGRGRITLAEIEAGVAARLGPGRVTGNAQPAVFSRQVAMYLASQVGGWSTTQIGKFYNGRDHSTVCYAIGRIKVLRETDPEVDGLLTVLTDELRNGMESKRPLRTRSASVSDAHTVPSFIHESALDALAEEIASRVLAKLMAPQFAPRSAADTDGRPHVSEI